MQASVTAEVDSFSTDGVENAVASVTRLTQALDSPHNLYPWPRSRAASRPKPSAR